MNFKALASNLDFDEEDFKELVELFIETSFSDLEKINFGLEENNATSIAQAAHSIKGASGSLGFQPIATMAQDIEMRAKEGNINDLEEIINSITEELKKIEYAIKEN